MPRSNKDGGLLLVNNLFKHKHQSVENETLVVVSSIMSEPPVKKSRIRSSDLLKISRTVGESKYDFSKIVHLKGTSGRDRSKRGRPEGIANSGNFSRSQIPAGIDCLQNQEDVQLGTFDLQFSEDSEDVSMLTPNEIYLNLIKEKGAIFCIDNLFQNFVLKDIDINRSQLKASQYLFLSRRSLSFAGEFHWVYTCSCDPAAKELIDCCTQQMDVTFEAFKERIPGCMHTSVLTVLLDQFDSQNMIDPSNFDHADEVEEDIGLHATESNQDVCTEIDDGLFLIKARKGMGIVDGTKCLTCNASVVRCVHLNIYVSIHGEQDSCHDTKKTHKQSCFSKMRIPFHSSVTMQETYKQSLSNRFVIENGQIILKPEVDVCDSCGSKLDEMEQTVTANVFVLNQIMEAVVSVKQCVNCDRKIYFDGLNQCVLNMGKHVICHEMLRHFMVYFLTGKTTIFTEYSVLNKVFSDAGFHDFIEKMSYQDFKDSWYSFLELLDIDFDNCFHCPDCGPDPDTVIMDATSVAFRKELLSWKHLFSTNSIKPEPYDKADSSRVKERTLYSKVVRYSLIDFAKPTKGISKEAVEKMLKIIEIENGSPEIVHLLEIIIKNSTIKGDRYFCSETWRELVKVLASSNPFCSFLPPSESFFVFLDNVFSEPLKVLQDDSHLKNIQTTVPVIFRLLTKLKEKFPFKEFKACLPYFQQKVFAPFLGKKCPSEDPEEDDDELSFFPSLPRVRRRGFFVADRKKSNSSKDFVCNKLSQGHPSLLPGVFTLFCPHGICYGFQVMKFHESPDVPFTLLRTRFQTAPKLVIYDNACSLQTYCLNRDPTFFMQTVFRVDGLHFKNHKACGPSFELKSYPQFAELNSQVVEQSNSRLQRVKGSLSYMTQSNFMKHCKFYLWGQNDEILSKIKSESNIKQN